MFIFKNCLRLKRVAALLNAPSTGIYSPAQSRLKQKTTNSKMSNGTIKSWVKGVERRQRILNETSLMRVEFKYENKAVPTASLAGTEALRCRDGRRRDRDTAQAVSRDHHSRRLASKLPLDLHRHSTLTSPYSLPWFTSHVTPKIIFIRSQLQINQTLPHTGRLGLHEIESFNDILFFADDFVFSSYC